MPSRQKNKGNNFERVVAKHLSNVFGYNFERVPTSGAMTGGINEHVLDRLSRSQKLLLEGDLIPPDEMYNIKIECNYDAITNSVDTKYLTHKDYNYLVNYFDDVRLEQFKFLKQNTFLF